MPHEDFFEATLIEFSIWEDGIEKTIKKYKKFEDIPKKITDGIDEQSQIISFRGKKWKILEINRDQRAHGKGTHVKIRLEKQT